ncbi:uncharacterized protein DS421_5g142040 [Arachis hypogaea]|nr:uncharacterized protein DS421_5g142040 [Arachis hypogaea]
MHPRDFSLPSQGLDSGSSPVTLCSDAPPFLEFQPLCCRWVRISLLSHHCCTPALSLLSLARVSFFLFLYFLFLKNINIISFFLIF